MPSFMGVLTTDCCTQTRQPLATASRRKEEQFWGWVDTPKYFFKIILNYDMVSDGVPISQSDLIKFYHFEVVRLYYSMMGLTFP